MPNNLLWVDTIAQNIKAKLFELNAKYYTKLYDTTVKLTRGVYGFNVIPMEFITRELSSTSSLPDIKVDMFCYYTMESSEDRSKQWLEFLKAIDAVRDALLPRAAIPAPMATVKIDVNFHDDLLDMKMKLRAINCVMSFTYQKYAFDA
jgi:hypothetical protein